MSATSRNARLASVIAALVARLRQREGAGARGCQRRTEGNRNEPSVVASDPY